MNNFIKPVLLMVLIGLSLGGCSSMDVRPTVGVSVGVGVGLNP